MTGKKAEQLYLIPPEPLGKTIWEENKENLFVTICVIGVGVVDYWITQDSTHSMLLFLAQNALTAGMYIPLWLRSRSQDIGMAENLTIG
jgi:hypothetical protein